MIFFVHFKYPSCYWLLEEYTRLIDFYSGSPDALFAGKDNVIDSLFDTLENTTPKIQKAA
ncbi:hypothetical protein [Thiothrix fructosivorans]|uniref:Uncharacterized protein n=1 Tax=Thiothrix fructosivorans TaxID=111770 RepID=A0ABS3ILE0_9GAMM|nr:hypothetical protein [Thiothrix fructosivorans]MBO0613770.1 hypothetical protein [Thiothrix fructosivorans]